MKVGYVRVSTVEQKTARQEVIMQELGVEKVYLEKLTGMTQKGREQLDAMLSCGHVTARKIGTDAHARIIYWQTGSLFH